MQVQNWNEKMAALLAKRKWDMKDWRRATKFDQHAIENLLNTDTTGFPQENLDSIYEATQHAKLDKGMLRFDQPVIIAVWAHKGGTGKSTTVANLSYELSKRGYNVLVIDTDSQSDVTSVLYPQYLERPDINFYDAFSMRDDFAEEGYIVSTDYNGLDIIPGSEKCEALEGTMCLMEERLRVKIWPKCLRRIREENYYDFVLVDMDKTAGMMNKSIFEVADYVLSPVEPAIFAVKSLLAIITQIEQSRAADSKLKLLGIF
ncbi:MAG: AAA family ATPase, partial [Butyrivibrio sp.]|nr:AAA family ATPase [Butyrivibrio sp.]